MTIFFRLGCETPITPLAFSTKQKLNYPSRSGALSPSSGHPAYLCPRRHLTCHSSLDNAAAQSKPRSCAPSLPPPLTTSAPRRLLPPAHPGGVRGEMGKSRDWDTARGERGAEKGCLGGARGVQHVSVRATQTGGEGLRAGRLSGWARAPRAGIRRGREGGRGPRGGRRRAEECLPLRSRADRARPGPTPWRRPRLQSNRRRARREAGRWRGRGARGGAGRPRAAAASRRRMDEHLSLLMLAAAASARQRAHLRSSPPRGRRRPHAGEPRPRRARRGLRAAARHDGGARDHLLEPEAADGGGTRPQGGCGGGGGCDRYGAAAARMLAAVTAGLLRGASGHQHLGPGLRRRSSRPSASSRRRCWATPSGA